MFRLLAMHTTMAALISTTIAALISTTIAAFITTTIAARTSAHQGRRGVLRILHRGIAIRAAVKPSNALS